MTKAGSNQRNRGGATPRKVISIGSISQDVTLHKAESAWKPGRKQDQAEIDEDTKKTEVMPLVFVYVRKNTETKTWCNSHKVIQVWQNPVDI